MIKGSEENDGNSHRDEKFILSYPKDYKRIEDMDQMEEMWSKRRSSKADSLFSAFVICDHTTR